MITALPSWIDKGLAVYHNADVDKFSLAQKQAALWQRNIKCLAAPPTYYPNMNNVQVDATICRKTGDVFVQVLTPENKSVTHWVALDEILPAKDGKKVAMIPSAFAAAKPLQLAGEPRTAHQKLSSIDGLRLAQGVTVVCQRFINPRMVLRHIRTPQGCIDEVIDTFNGAVVSRTPVPCRNGC